MTWKFPEQPLSDWELSLLTKQIKDKLDQNIQLSTRVRTLLDKIDQTPDYFEATRDLFDPCQIFSSHKHQPILALKVSGRNVAEGIQMYSFRHTAQLITLRDLLKPHP